MSIPMSDQVNESELSDLELLSQSLQEAMDAHVGGVIAGPGLDEVALRRSERRARAAEVNHRLRTRVSAEEAIA